MNYVVVEVSMLWIIIAGYFAAAVCLARLNATLFRDMQDSGVVHLLNICCAPAYIAFLFIGAGISGPIEHIYQRRQVREEKKLQAQFSATGRFMEWPAVETKLKSGPAKLTEVPVPDERRRDPRKYVTGNLGGGVMTAIVMVTGRKLAEKYPQGKIVTLIGWDVVTILAVGDAEAVFLVPPKKPNAAGAQSDVHG
jgi:hypothetical protein